MSIATRRHMFHGYLIPFGSPVSQLESIPIFHIESIAEAIPIHYLRQTLSLTQDAILQQGKGLAIISKLGLMMITDAGFHGSFPTDPGDCGTSGPDKPAPCRTLGIHRPRLRCRYPSRSYRRLCQGLRVKQRRMRSDSQRDDSGTGAIHELQDIFPRHTACFDFLHHHHLLR